jgi:hypothetical protein
MTGIKTTGIEIPYFQGLGLVYLAHSLSKVMGAPLEC